MYTALLIVHVIVAVSLVVLVLVQHGRGADAGAAFGGGASATLFGARGSATFLSRATAVLAVLFFVMSLTLATLSGQRRAGEGSVIENLEKRAAPGIEEEAPLPPQDLPEVPQ